MPSIFDLEFKYNSTYPIQFLADVYREQDTGPEELDLSEFIDVDTLKEHHKARRLRRNERRQGRTHKAQTFRRL